jgi:hypothetical protein
LSTPFVAQEPADAEAVKAALGRVFARPEFQPERHALRDWINRQIESIAEWLRGFFGISREAADEILAWVFYLSIALIAALLIAWVVRAITRSLRGGNESVESQSAHDLRGARVAELRERARAAEARGEHALALRLYFWALVVGLGERGGLEYRDAWTNRELLERGAPRPEVARVLAPLVPELDRRVFGREPAEASDVARLASLCDDMLGVAR